jgi:hypothetical protein
MDESHPQQAEPADEFLEEHIERCRLEAERLRRDFPELEGVDLETLEWIVNSALTLQSVPEPLPELLAVSKHVPAAARALEGWRARLVADCPDLDPHELDAVITGLKGILESLPPSATPPLAERLAAQVDMLLRPGVILSRMTMIHLIRRLRELVGAKVKGMSDHTIERAVDRRGNASNPLPAWHTVGWLPKPPSG